LCGSVTYTINEQCRFAVICHCEDCRRTSGSAYSTDSIFPTSAVTLAGDYKVYTTTGASGKAVHRHFCANCGSPIATKMDLRPEVIIIKAGTLSEDIQKNYKPEAEIFTDGRLSYIQERHGPQFGGQPPSGWSHKGETQETTN